jgi:hydrogenase maturation protease
MRVKCRKSGTGDLLVIGYGNELRSDDGVGSKIAELIRNLNLPGVRVLAGPQLSPELAMPISAAVRVVFVSAAKDSTVVQLRELRLPDSGKTMTHGADPQSLLQLTKLLYDRCPPALWLTVPAEHFGFGHDLSARCREAIQTAVDTIENLAKHHCAARRIPGKNGIRRSHCRNNASRRSLTRGPSRKIILTEKET